MTTLGIDWGESKVGLALAENTLAEPLMVVRYYTLKYLLDKLKEVTVSHNVKKIVIGVSEGLSGKKTREFGRQISEKLRLPVSFHNETLSTSDANVFSRQAGVSRTNRRSKEDAFAAAIMLQDYLDTKLV